MLGLEEEEAQPELRTCFPYEFSFPKRYSGMCFQTRGSIHLSR